MKALEQAAKERGETRGEPSASAQRAAGETKPELSLALELLATDGPASQAQADAATGGRPAGEDAGATTAGEPTHAGTVFRAEERVRGQHGERRQFSPLAIFVALSGLFAIGFATYVYLQIYHPAIFSPRAPPAPIPASPVVQSPAPAPSSIPSGTPGSAPIPSSAVLQPSAAESPIPAPAPPAALAAKPAAPAVNVASAAAGRIVVSGGTAAATVNPSLVEAYGALQAGNLEAAQRLYTQLARGEPKNIDALLGLAATAALQGRTEEATRHYQQILELDPRHALAQSGLIGLFGRGDPLAAETRLKQLIAREPSAFLHFTLGNLYADQSLWAQAQQAYFQAHHLDPGNPDYVYNLAVSLDHLLQSKLALEFYRQAIALAATRKHANFNAAQVQERIGRLATQVE